MKTKDLITKLEELYKTDQDIRKKYNKNPSQKIQEEMANIDKNSTEFMEEVLQKFGLLTISKVGEIASRNAWILIQHSGKLQLMEKYLTLMEENFEDINKQDYALLKDRVLIQQGKKQIYGSQFIKDKKGNYVPVEIEDIENVNKRRKEMGMDTLEEHTKIIEDMYGKKNWK